MKANIAFAACAAAILAGCGGRAATLTPEQITAPLIKQNTTLVSYGVPAECFNPQPTGKDDTLSPDLEQTAQLQCRGTVVAARRRCAPCERSPQNSQPWILVSSTAMSGRSRPAWQRPHSSMEYSMARHFVQT